MIELARDQNVIYRHSINRPTHTNGPRTVELSPLLASQLGEKNKVYIDYPTKHAEKACQLILSDGITDIRIIFT